MTKRHPLSKHAVEVLQRLARGPIPSMEINPGVIGKFCTEHLVELVQLPSPYQSHRGKTCEHAQITERGKRVARGEPPDLDAAS